MSSGWWLLARARHSSRTLVAITALACVEFAVGSSSHEILGENRTLSIPWAVVLPAVAAVVVGVGTRSAVLDLENTTLRSLPGLRAAHLGLLVGVAIVTTAIGSSRLDPRLTSDLSGPGAIRNLAAFTGISLASAALLGSSLAWPVPLALAIAATTVGATGGLPHWWALPIRPDGDAVAGLAAVTLLALGSAAVVVCGTREPSAEAE